MELQPRRPAARARTDTPLTIRVAVAGPDGDGGRGVARSPGAVAEAYAEACTELAARLATVTAERDEAQVSLADTRRALAIAGDLDRRDVAMTVKRMLACVAESAGAARASFAFVTADGFDRVVDLSGDGTLLLDSPGGRRYLQALAQADGPCLQEAACDLELWALLGGGERHLSALASLPLRTTSRTVGLAVLYFLEDDPLPTPAALEHLELVASVFAAPLAPAAPAEATVPPAALVPVLAWPKRADRPSGVVRDPPLDAEGAGHRPARTLIRDAVVARTRVVQPTRRPADVLKPPLDPPSSPPPRALRPACPHSGSKSCYSEWRTSSV